MFSCRGTLCSWLSVDRILIAGDEVLHACFSKLDIFGNVKNIGISDSIVKKRNYLRLPFALEQQFEI